MTPRPFLAARWSHIILLSFEAPEDLIRRAIPPGVEPDRWDGRTHVSLVALQMLDLRIKGWRIPGFRAHPQVNFRTYVRVAGEAGVWFVRQFVSSRLIAAVGRLRYGEPFWPTPIRSRVVETQSEVRVEYGVGPAALGWHVSVAGSRATLVPPPDSPEHYFIERAFACRARPDGNLGVFRVAHPAWAVRQIHAVDYRFDFGSLYGTEWEFLNRAQPAGVVFAAGSEVAVYTPSDSTGLTDPAAPP
ncbi:MAG TPA: DUF2071 domain-containing protein [Gemmatimonadales bacterium]|nr:DUF2071 domain-containing protein [Gemmatimonadales bacterium]